MTERLETEDLAALTPAQLVSVVVQGFTSHLDTPQLTREQLSGLTPDEIVAARRVGMLATVQGQP